MSQIRAILFKLRATIVLVAVAAVFTGGLFSAPTSARAGSASFGFSAPCDHHPWLAVKAGAPVKRLNGAAPCPDCCLFGGVGVLALPIRASYVSEPPAETGLQAFFFESGSGATELLIPGAANGARAPPVVI
jgi:hypothetical protein